MVKNLEGSVVWSENVKAFPDDVLHISGNAIPVKRGKLKQGDLSFWENNPRIYSIVHQTDTPLDQEEIQSELLGLEHVKKLVNAIAHHGNLQNSIIVLDQKFEVIEGNSRLAAWRYLSQKDPNLFSEMPSVILPFDTSEELIYSYLNQEHIEGKTKWSAYEQAGVIFRLVKSGKDLDSLKQEMNISRQAAQRMYETYKMMVDCGEDRPNRYSYYEVYLANGKAKTKRKSEPKLDERIIEEIRKNEVTAQEFRKMLPIVCDDTREFGRFLTGKSSLLGSYESLEEKGKTKSLVVQLKSIHEQVRGMKKSEFDALGAKPQAEAEFRLKRITSTLQSLKKQVYGK